MTNYYVNRNAQSNGDHEVHQQGCYWLSLVAYPQYLGLFLSCHGAVQEAKKFYPTANGCIHCSRPCHTS